MTALIPRPAAKQHARIWADGVDLTCNTLIDLSISGGRGDRFGQADPATCNFRVQLDAGMAVPDIGAVVHVAGWLPGAESTTRSALFTGKITDVALENDVLSAVAVDPTREIDGVLLGASPFPSETWQARFDKVWALTRTALGSPSWMTGVGASWNLYDQAQGVGAPTLLMLPRDVDRRRARDLLDELFRYFMADCFYIPHASDIRSTGVTGSVCPADPSAWTPRAGYRNGLHLPASWHNPATTIRRCLIGQYPRRWRNLTSLINDVKVITHGYAAALPVNVAEHSDHASDAASQAAHGFRSTTISTALLAFSNSTNTTPTNAGDWLAKAWLARTRYPSWGLDNLTVNLLKPLYPSGADQSREALPAWKVLSHGVSQLGRKIMVEPADPAAAAEPWCVEGIDVAWHEDGWILNLSCSDPKTYDGTLTAADQPEPAPTEVP